MHEAEKLAEARYFFDRMRQAEANWDEAAFTNELSAFLSAARSVLQYAHLEAEAAGQLRWYDSAVATDPSIKFMKEIRDNNIHERPVSPALAVTQEVGPTLGGVEHSTIDREWFLWGWAGNESALALAERYLGAVELVVKDGRANGILRA